MSELAELESIDGDFSARHVLSWLVGGWGRRITLGLLVVAPLVVLLAGGFTYQPGHRERVFEPGEPVDVGPYTLELSEFFVVDALDSPQLTNERNSWIGIVGVVTANLAEGAFYAGNLAVLPEEIGMDTEDLWPDGWLHQYDGSYVGKLQPGLSTPVVILYEIEHPEALGSGLTISFSSATTVTDAVRGVEWVPDHPLGTVTLPRTEVLPEILRLPSEETP